jgi:hypothetical protein
VDRHGNGPLDHKSTPTRSTASCQCSKKTANVNGEGLVPAKFAIASMAWLLRVRMKLDFT